MKIKSSTRVILIIFIFLALLVLVVLISSYFYTSKYINAQQGQVMALNEAKSKCLMRFDAKTCQNLVVSKGEYHNYGKNGISWSYSVRNNVVGIGISMDAEGKMTDSSISMLQ